MKNHCFLAHLRRLFIGPYLYIAILLYCLLLLIPSVGSPLAGNVLDLMFFSQVSSSGFSYFTATAVVAMAYAMTYPDDTETRLLYMWSLRSGTGQYAVSYYITTLVGGFLTSLGGMLLFCGIHLLAGLPFFGENSGNFSMYDALFTEGKLVLFTVTILLEYALGAAAMAGVSAMFASIFHRKAAALGIPVVLYFLFNMYPVHGLLNPLALTGIQYYSLGLPQLVSKLLAVGVYTVTCGLVTVWQIKRSVANA